MWLNEPEAAMTLWTAMLHPGDDYSMYADENSGRIVRDILESGDSLFEACVDHLCGYYNGRE